MSDHKGYYSSLEVSITSSSEEIKKSYRRLALLNHPDKNPADSEAAKKKFQLISQAYAVLSDAEKRAAYDEGADEDEDLDEDDLEEFFFQAFGGGLGGMAGPGRGFPGFGGFFEAAMMHAMFSEDFFSSSFAAPPRARAKKGKRVRVSKRR